MCIQGTGSPPPSLPACPPPPTPSLPHFVLYVLHMPPIQQSRKWLNTRKNGDYGLHKTRYYLASGHKLRFTHIRNHTQAITRYSHTNIDVPLMLIKIASEWLGADLIFPILLPVHDTFQVLLVFSLTGRDIGALTGQNTESQPISPPKSQWGPSGSQILHFIIVHGLGLMRRVRGRHCLGQHRIPIPVAVKVPPPRIVVFPGTLEPPF